MLIIPKSSNKLENILPSPIKKVRRTEKNRNREKTCHRIAAQKMEYLCLSGEILGLISTRHRFRQKEKCKEKWIGYQIRKLKENHLKIFLNVSIIDA